VDTTTKQKRDDDSVGCPCCLELITAATDYIKCDSCLNMFHQECTGLSNDVFKVLISIISQSGWVCRQHWSELNNVKTALAKANEKLAGKSQCNGNIAMNGVPINPNVLNCWFATVATDPDYDEKRKL